MIEILRVEPTCIAQGDEREARAIAKSGGAIGIGSSYLARRREQRGHRDRGRDRMSRIIAGKLALALVTLAFVLTFNFFLFRAIGDPRDDLLRVPR